VAEQHTLTVKVTGDSSQLVAALNRAQAELAQLDRQSNQTNAGFGTLGMSAGSASGALGSMSNVMAGIGWGVAISGAIAVGTELYNIGRASQVATNTFNQLQGGAEQASKSLALLQEATKFSVPDTTLMSISNLYTQMGLATDPTEVARLAEMGASLGQAMGSSAEEAMRTFSFLLSNQSIELLDTFGISSGKVRERIEELQKANQGLARDQAFVTAVLEEGAVAMERLGVVTEQNVSSVGKLVTRFQNLAADIGRPIASATEAVAGLIEAELQARDTFEDITSSGSAMFERYSQDIQAVLEKFNILTLAQLRATSVSGAELAGELGVYGVPIGDDAFTTLEQYLSYLDEIRRTSFETLDMPTNVFSDPQQLRALEAQERQRQILQRNIEDLDLILLDQENLTYALEQFTGGAGIITAEEVAYADELVIRIRQLAEDIGEDSDAVKGALKFADELERASQNALDAKNYIDNIGLETVLGLGLPPEQRLTADILTAAGIGGRQAEFLTGQRTITSEMFDERVLPLIQAVGETFGEDEAAILGDRIADLMRAGIARGLENNPVDLISFIMRGAGYDLESGEGRSVVVQAGDTLSSIAAREGVTVEFLAAINKLEDPNMILTGSELVVEVGARVTRLLPPLLPTADEIGLDASTLGMIYGGQPMTDENDKPITPLSPIRDDALETLATSQEIVTTLEELDPPELTPARLGLVSGDVAEVGSLEVVNMIDAKLKEISGKIYKVNMTVELDARIRTGAGFKIIPITMAEIQSDLRAASNILRTPLGQ